MAYCKENLKELFLLTLAKWRPRCNLTTAYAFLKGSYKDDRAKLLRSDRSYNMEQQP